jgi:hypothetical protein
MKNALGLNQFALPRCQSGGTRHISLFSRIDAWTHLVIAGNRNHRTQQVFDAEDEGFRLTWVLDRECGCLGGPRSFSESLRSVYEACPEQRAPWGGHGRQLITKRFSRSAAAENLSAVLVTASLVGPAPAERRNNAHAKRSASVK